MTRRPDANGLTDGVRAWYADPGEHAIWADRRVTEGLNPTERGFVARYFDAPARVLNVGCGGGREAIALARLGHAVTAVDLMETFLAAAREHAARAGVAVEFRAADVTDLPFPDGSFDRVVMIGQMIGQVPRRAGRLRALAECRRVLADGGALFCSTNAIERSWRYAAYFRVVNAVREIYNPHGLERGDAFVFRTGGRFRPWRSKRKRSIYHWYRREEFLADLAAAGFRCAESQRRWEAERDDPAAGRLLGGETYYFAVKA
jgi:ubiquinone/menaquinone biosynthesis C-methylase UbiE